MLHEVLVTRTYPGRGCLVARTQTGLLAFAYFLTGRSDASRARAVTVLERGDIVIRSTVGSSDDPLRHYAAAARRGRWTVVGNGDQVEAIADALAAGGSITGSAAEHSFEPDGPIFTSRIWLAREEGGNVSHLGVAQRCKRANGAPNRVIWTVDDLAPGDGVLMSTYDGTPGHVTRTTRPVDVTTEAANPSELVAEIWRTLAPELRVGTFAILPDRPDIDPVVMAS
jgi:IMP cyclohydrolase